MTTVELKVAMMCGGCEAAVRRVLDKLDGVESVDINRDTNKVTVTGNVTPEKVFETVSKTGKATEYWS